MKCLMKMYIRKCVILKNFLFLKFKINWYNNNNMSSEPSDKNLYKRVKKMADKKFQAKTGIYKSSWIVSQYKRLGGKYIGVKPKNSGLKRWYKEKWVDLNKPIKKSGKVIGYKPCGRKSLTPVRQGILKSGKNQKYPLCRPTKRVSFATPKTFSEISKRDIALAKIEKQKIRHTGNIKFGGAQFYGKKSDIMIPVPENVKKVALYSYKLKDLGFGGGIETGWKRARQLSTQKSIPIEDLRYMRNWFARHIYASYPSYKMWKKADKPLNDKKWHSKHGIISWYIWGGNAAFKWVNSQKNISLLNKQYGKSYEPIKLPK